MSAPTIEANPKHASGQSKSEPTRTKLRISGMSCVNCVRHVSEAIQSVAGVSHAAVNLEQGLADVRWVSEAQKNVPAVLNAVKEVGYEATVCG